MRWQTTPLIFVIVVAASCAAPQKPIVKPTQAHLANVKAKSLEELRSDGVEFTGEITLEVRNPNRFSLPIKGGQWKLRVGDEHGAVGEFRLDKIVPAGGVATVTGNLQVDPRTALEIARYARATREYTIDGALRFGARSVGDFHVDFSWTGSTAELGDLVRQAALIQDW